MRIRWLASFGVEQSVKTSDFAAKVTILFAEDRVVPFELLYPSLKSSLFHPETVRNDIGLRNRLL